MCTPCNKRHPPPPAACDRLRCPVRAVRLLLRGGLDRACLDARANAAREQRLQLHERSRQALARPSPLELCAAFELPNDVPRCARRPAAQQAPRAMPPPPSAETAPPRRAAPHAPQRSGACADARLRPTTANLAADRRSDAVPGQPRTHEPTASRRCAPTATCSRRAAAHSEMVGGRLLRTRRPGRLHAAVTGCAPPATSSARSIGYEVGENIAWGTLWLATPKAIVAGWMASPGHRANILDATFKDTGVGVSPHPVASLRRRPGRARSTRRTSARIIGR